MAAAALPIALAFGAIAELTAGLVSRLLGGERAWWRGVSGLGSDAVRAIRDKDGRERVAVVEAGGAAAALLGAGMASAGALGVGPGDLVLLYLGLAVASAGALVVASVQTTPTGQAEAGRRRVMTALAEPAFAVGLGAMFLRYGSLELDAVRGTQQVLGTGAVLGPALAAAGLALGVVAFLSAGALRLPEVPPPGVRGRGLRAGAASSILLRLSRWALAGSTALLAGVLVAGGGIEPISLAGILPVAAGAAASAVVVGAAAALLGRLAGIWRMAAPGIAFVVAVAAVVMVVVA